MLTDVRSMRSTARWQRLREAVRRRQKYVCALCRTRLVFDVHHKIPAEAAPERFFDADNLVGLCEECHNRVHKAYNMGFRWEDFAK